MDSNKVGYWIQVGANIGILGGLFLVGVQINQNTSAIKAQMNAGAHESLLQFEYTMMGENPSAVWAKSIENPKDLTLAEQRLIDAYFYSYLERWRHSYDLAENGFVDEEQWRRFAQSEAAYILGNAYGRAWWKRWNDQSELLPPELKSVIESSLESAPYTTEGYFSTIQEGLE